MWWIDIAVSVVLLIASYLGVAWYLNEKKLSIGAIKLNLKRVCYMVIGCVMTGMVIYRLNATYQLNIISRLNLLSLLFIVLPAAAVDMKVQKIPNAFLLVGLAIRCVILCVLYIIDVGDAWNITKDAVIGAAVIGIFFLLMTLIFKNSVGMGDIKLFALMGLYQGLWGVINSVFFSLVAIFFASVFCLVTKKKNRKDSIAFGPSIYIGTVIAMCMAGM